MIHTPPSPTSKNRGPDPTSISDTTSPVSGSTRTTRSSATYVIQTPPSPARTAVPPSGTSYAATISTVPGSIRTSTHPEQSSPSAIVQMPPSPAPMLDSPSAGTSTATHPVTVPVSGSTRATPRLPHVAVHTAPNPESMPAHGDCGTATEPCGRPVRASKTPMPLPRALTHVRPKSTSTQSALDGARIASPPVCCTLVISGRSGSGCDEGVSASVADAPALLVSPSPPSHATSESTRTSITPGMAITRTVASDAVITRRSPSAGCRAARRRHPAR